MTATFQQTAASIAAMPAVLEAKVTPIQVDLSPVGVLSRLEELAQSAQQRGDIPAASQQEIVAAIATLKTALGKIDQTKLMKGVAVAPLAKALP
jgi:hypothetical protein